MAKSDNGELNSNILGSNTSDPNNSLLKKVKNRVSGLFPSSLTKWFGPSEGQSIVRRRESVEDDDDEDTTQLQQPPKKRAKPSTDFTPNNFTVTSTPLVNSYSDLRHQPGPSGYTRHETTIVNGDDKSDSGDSNNGYTSIFTQQKDQSCHSDIGNSLNQSNISKSSLNKSLNASLNNSRSLFSDQSLNPQRKCMSSRRPSFSASTFGSPSFVDRTLSTKRAVNSPFYGGRTIYGGASAYRRNKIVLPRNETKTFVDIKPAKESTSSNDTVNLSKTARRILDALEHFSTPVLDAKKIPSINKKSEPLISARKTPYSREKSASTKELLIPTIPDLLKMKMKERLQDSTVQVRKVAVSSKSVLNTEYSIPTIEENPKPQKHVNKIKSKIASTRVTVELDTIDSVKLPDVQLPISTLPKFDFTLPPPPAAIIKSQTATVVKKPEEPKTKQFEFAKPIIVSEKPKSVNSINNFKFSEPLNAKSSEKSTTLTFKASESNTAPRRKEPTKNNGQNDVGFSLQPPAQFESGSVMDVLGKPEKKPESDNLMDKFKPALGTWECNSCLVRNIPSATRCISCEAMKDPPKKDNFGFKFKMPSDKWECSVCLVRNNNSDTKCVACTTPKPGAPLPVSKPTEGFGDKFKPNPGSWECSSCMLRNEFNATKCAACETLKPGSKPEVKTVLTIFETKTEFNDLIKKQQEKWECPSCLVRNPLERKICECCEAPKPGEKQEIKFSSTGFKFGLDTNTPTTFSFGITPTNKPTEAKTTVAAPIVTTGFTFGIPATSKKETIPIKPITTTSETSKPTETVFNFSLPAPVSTSSSTTTNIFGTTTTQPTFTFGMPSASTSLITTSATTTTITSVNSNLFDKPPAPVPVTTPQFKMNSSTVTTQSTTLITFGSTNKPLFGSDKPPVPQFNFGSSSGLPFNPAPAKTETSTFSFNAGNTNKSESKPFSFPSSSASTKIFSFAQEPTKAPVFNFGAASTPAPAPAPTPTPTPLVAATAASSNTSATNNFFTFGNSKSEKQVSFEPTPAQPQIQQPQSQPQNGGFNYGSSNTSINFNFGASNSNSSPAVFGFGSNQAGTGSTAPGVFTFGGAAPPQQQIPAFSPDVKPNFNFTGGSLPSFTAQGVPSASTLPQRKIRKAVRRTQPR